MSRRNFSRNMRRLRPKIKEKNDNNNLSDDFQDRGRDEMSRPLSAFRPDGTDPVVISIKLSEMSQAHICDPYPQWTESHKQYNRECQRRGTRGYIRVIFIGYDDSRECRWQCRCYNEHLEIQRIHLETRPIIRMTAGIRTILSIEPSTACQLI